MAQEQWEAFKAKCMENPNCKDAYEQAVQRGETSFIYGERGEELVELPPLKDRRGLR